MGIPETINRFVTIILKSGIEISVYSQSGLTKYSNEALKQWEDKGETQQDAKYHSVIPVRA